MEEIDLDSSAGDFGNFVIYLHRRRNRAAPVELAAAAALRLAPDYLLASAWNSGAVPHPLWRIWRPRFGSLQLPSSHGRAHGQALGAHDARGAGTIPARYERTLRLWHIYQRGQRTMKPYRQRNTHLAQKHSLCD